VAASLLGPVVLAAQSVLLVSASTTFQAPYSLSIAAAVRVGNLLGESNGKRAAVATHAAFFIAFFIAMGWRCGSCPMTGYRTQLISTYSAMFLIFRNRWGKLFNDDPGMALFLLSRFETLSLAQM